MRTMMEPLEERRLFEIGEVNFLVSVPPTSGIAPLIPTVLVPLGPLDVGVAGTETTLGQAAGVTVPGSVLANGVTPKVTASAILSVVTAATVPSGITSDVAAGISAIAAAAGTFA